MQKLPFGAVFFAFMFFHDMKLLAQVLKILDYLIRQGFAGYKVGNDRLLVLVCRAAVAARCDSSFIILDSHPQMVLSRARMRENRSWLLTSPTASARILQRVCTRLLFYI